MNCKNTQVLPILANSCRSSQICFRSSGSRSASYICTYSAQCRKASRYLSLCAQVSKDTWYFCPLLSVQMEPGHGLEAGSGRLIYLWAAQRPRNPKGCTRIIHLEISYRTRSSKGRASSGRCVIPQALVRGSGTRYLGADSIMWLFCRPKWVISPYQRAFSRLILFLPLTHRHRRGQVLLM